MPFQCHDSIRSLECQVQQRSFQGCTTSINAGTVDLLFSLYSLSVKRIFKMDSNNEVKPTAVVKPFSINKQQICFNCEKRAFIRGMMGFCRCCERVYRSMYREVQPSGNTLIIYLHKI